MIRQRILACAFTCCPPAKPGFTGGEDVLGWNLLQQIARFHDVWVLTHAEDRTSLEQALAEKPVSNISFHYVGLPSWIKPLLKIQGGHQLYYYLWQINAYFAARRLHRRVRFDLFHHITYANDWMASPIGALLPVPYVRGPGGGSHRTPKALESEYRLGGRLWERVRDRGQWLFRHDPLFIKGHSRARAIMVCNRESESKVPRRWAGKVHIFPVSGVSSRDLATVSFENSQGGPFRILSAGTLLRIKGFGLAIKAFKTFVEKHPDAEFELVGSGPEEQKLKALVRRIHAGSKVHFVPAMPRGELLRKMAAADVFLFPSLRDGGGTVAIEAMAVGKPVICLDVGGPGMHITEECGIKVTPGSAPDTVHKLADALERLYLDKDLRHKLGKAAQEKAKRSYHWDRLGERLMEIYQPAIQRAHSN